MGWLLGFFGALVLVIVLLPVPRRLAVMGLVFTRRLFPVLLRKLRLWRQDRTLAKSLRLAFEDLGPTFIKFGQMIASSPTAFPKHVSDEFGRCLDNVRPMPQSAVFAVLEREFGAPPDTIFETVDRQPLASASIAQVHAATLSDGSEVVLKIQRPGLEGRIDADMRIMRLLARMAMRINKELRRANLIGIVDDFDRTLREEMDFEHEARNIKGFNALMEEQQLTDIACAPRVHDNLTSRYVLTMERFYGCRIDDKAGVAARVEDVKQLLRNTSKVFWSCVFLGGFFHGDIHAGNIMILDDGRLGYIDFGILGRFTDANRVAIAHWVGALVSADGEQMAVAIKSMDAVPEDVDWDVFVEDVTESFIPLRDITVEDVELIENDFFPKLRVLMRKHDAQLPASFVLILKQLTYVSRYVLLHDPTFNENTDPTSQAAFVKIFMKFNAWRASVGAPAISIKPVVSSRKPKTSAT